MAQEPSWKRKPEPSEPLFQKPKRNQNRRNRFSGTRTRTGTVSSSRGNFNRYTKRPLQDSAIIFSTPGMGESAFCCANHRVSCKCQQPPGWKIHRFFRWKMPFAVFRSGSGVSDPVKTATSVPELLRNKFVFAFKPYNV